MPVRRLHSSKKEIVLVVALALTGLLLAATALYCRAEWLEARRALDQERGFKDAAQRSANFWQEKYHTLRYVRPLTPAQRALVRKWEKVQLK